MKRLYFALALVVIIAGIMGFGTFTVKTQADKMFGIFDEIETAVYNGQNEQAAVLTKQAEKMWVDAEQKLKIYVNHADISEVGLTIAGMTPLIEQNEVGEFMSEFKKAKIQLVHISALENIRYD